MAKRLRFWLMGAVPLLCAAPVLGPRATAAYAIGFIAAAVYPRLDEWCGFKQETP